LSSGEDQRERYARQLKIGGWGDSAQARLESSSVFIAGAGGLGCAASLYLTAAGVGRISICDRDSVERSNLNRQVLYSLEDLGKEKARVAAERLRRLNPHVEVGPLVADIDDATAPNLIAGSDLVLDCLDNIPARFVLNRAAIAARVPMIYGAIDEFTGYLSLLNPPETPCLECFLPRTDLERQPALPGCTAGLLGSLEAMEAIKFLAEIGETLAGRLLVVEGTEPRFDVVSVTSDPDCPACGHLKVI
jgi:molybdopterin/thiamine biosynthesis adenylyltransferase